MTKTRNILLLIDICNKLNLKNIFLLNSFLYFRAGKKSNQNNLILIKKFNHEI